MCGVGLATHFQTVFGRYRNHTPPKLPTGLNCIREISSLLQRSCQSIVRVFLRTHPEDKLKLGHGRLDFCTDPWRATSHTQHTYLFKKTIRQGYARTNSRVAKKLDCGPSSGDVHIWLATSPAFPPSKCCTWFTCMPRLLGVSACFHRSYSTIIRVLV